MRIIKNEKMKRAECGQQHQQQKIEQLSFFFSSYPHFVAIGEKKQEVYIID